MDRRAFIFLTTSFGLGVLSGSRAWAAEARPQRVVEKIHRSDEEWREILTPAQYHILRNEGTEPPRSSPLDKEYGKGIYLCAGCDLTLFTSEMKFDSGTGWPSFFDHIEGHIETKLDFKLIFPRTEYHCARCGGHQGHVFDDGPEPTGKRWCNNGLALRFVADQIPL